MHLGVKYRIHLIFSLMLHFFSPPPRHKFLADTELHTSSTSLKLRAEFMEVEEQITAALLNHVDEDDTEQDDSMVKHYLQWVNPWFERCINSNVVCKCKCFNICQLITLQECFHLFAKAVSFYRKKLTSLCFR